MTARVPQLMCLLAAIVALAVAGCGGDDEPEGEKLPPDITQTLLKHLDSIGDRVDAGVSGACDDIYSSDPDVGDIGPIDEELAKIPSDVDPEIRSALEQSFERLTQLVDQECDEIRSAEQDRQGTVTDETPPPDTTPTDTDTVPTETTDTTPTPPPTTPTTPTTPTAPPSGNGPDGDGPPGQDRGGAEAPNGGE